MDDILRIQAELQKGFRVTLNGFPCEIRLQQMRYDHTNGTVEFNLVGIPRPVQGEEAWKAVIDE